MKSHNFIKTTVSVFCLLFFTSTNAAIIDVSELNVDSITISISSPVFSQTDTIVFTPPDTWTMGVYQGEITDFNTGSINLFVESTGAYGSPPSSGTVDTSLGTIDLNLSDIHMTVTGLLSGDFDLWDSGSSSFAIDSNSYNSVTGEFLYGWSDTATLYYSLLPYNVDYSIEVAGTASTVPVPAAVWLFGSGLLGLIGIARRKKS